jgi:hypothetical protein
VTLQPVDFFIFELEFGSVFAGAQLQLQVVVEPEALFFFGFGAQNLLFLFDAIDDIRVFGSNVEQSFILERAQRQSSSTTRMKEVVSTHNCSNVILHHLIGWPALPQSSLSFEFVHPFG